MNTLKFLLCGLILGAPACYAQEKPNENRLTDAQKQALDKAKVTIEAETRSKTTAFAVKAAEVAKNLDRNLLSEQPDTELDRKLQTDLVQMISEMVSSAIQTKMAADRDLIKLLTPQQKKMLLAEVEKSANPDLEELIDKLFGDKK